MIFAFSICCCLIILTRRDGTTLFTRACLSYASFPTFVVYQWVMHRLLWKECGTVASGQAVKDARVMRRLNCFVQRYRRRKKCINTF